MAQKTEMSSKSSGQLKPVLDELKKQKKSDEPKLKRSPSPQEKIRTNDAISMVIAKLYVSTQKEQQINKQYRKEQADFNNKFKEDLIKTVKLTNASLKKTIEKSIKINEKILEENKTTNEKAQLFSEETEQEKNKSDQQRHEELIKAIKEGSEEKGSKAKKEKEGGFLGLLTGAAMFITKLFPSFGKFVTVIKGLYKLGEVVFKIARFILPLAKDLVMFLVRNPAVLAALGTLAAVVKMQNVTEEAKTNKEKEIANQLKSIEASSKDLAERGDVAALKKLQEQRDELKGKQVVIDVMENRPIEKSLSTKLAKENETYVEDKLYAAAQAGSKPAQDQLEKMDQERIRKEVGTKQTYNSKTYSPEGIEISDTGITYEEASKDAKQKIIKEREERFKKSETSRTEEMNFAEVVNKNFETIKKREGFRTKTYASAEGGTDTVGIGHKLTNDEAKAGGVYIKGQLVKVDRNTPLTEQQVLDLYYQDINKHMMGTRKIIGPDVFDKLPGNKQYALAELSFAGGPGLITPQLVKALKAGDMEKAEQVIRQTGRYYTKDKGTAQEKKVESPYHAKHADIRADMFAKGIPGDGRGTTQMVAATSTSSGSTETVTGLPSMAELEGINMSLMGEDASEKKPSIFGMLAGQLKDQLDLIEGFKTGEGAKELTDVLQSISPPLKTSAYNKTESERVALADGKNVGNILVNNAPTTVVNNGGGQPAQLAKAEVRASLPILEKVLYNYMT
jgi:GH24 family phage-related lysozyme (muramidase)